MLYLKLIAGLFFLSLLPLQAQNLTSSNNKADALLSSVHAPSQSKQMVRYLVDKEHTTLQFRATHMGLTEITGRFEDYTIDFQMENEDFLTAKLKLEVRTKSLNSFNPLRDAHLKGKDFFEVAKYPKMNFESTRVLADERPNTYKVQGVLTVKGIAKPVEVWIRCGKPVIDLKGERRVGFGGFTIVNRGDFDMGFDVSLDDGTPFVSQEIKLDIGMQFIQEASQ